MVPKTVDKQENQESSTEQNHNREIPNAVKADNVKSNDLNKSFLGWCKNVFSRIKTIWKTKKKGSSSLSIEEDGVTDDDSGVEDGLLGWENNYGTFEKSEKEVKTQLAKQFQDLISNYWESQSTDDGIIVLSDVLSYRLAEAVMRDSINEPCGLKGCRVLLYCCCHRNKGIKEHHFIGNLYPEMGLFATFEIILTLHANQVHSLTRCLSTSPRKFCNHFEQVKEKLYTCSSGRGSTQPSPGPTMS